MKKIALGLMVLFALSCQGYAGGYQVSLHGQRQIGMGLIGTSLSMDASSGFYNPAGLSLMKQQYSFLAGASGIFSSTAYQMPQPSLYQVTTDNPVGTPFYFYAGAKITDQLAVGLAVNTPFGNGLVWGDDWAGRYLIREISMSTITIQPTVSYKLAEFISLGAGFVYTIGQVDLARALPLQGPEEEASVAISGSTAAFGFNAGIMYADPEGLSVGLSYRSQIDMEVDDATARFSVPSSLPFPEETPVGVTLPLPANLDFGLSYQINPGLMVGMALNYVFWSAYDSLGFDFATNTPLLQDSQSPRQYSDRLIIRLGGQYQVNDQLMVRAGTYYDPSPVNENYFSPETPSLDNLAFTTGLSYFPMPNLSIDLSMLFIMGLEKEVSYSPENFAGTYESLAFIPGIGISYNF